MEKTAILSNPVLWTFLLFALAYFLYWYNKNKNGGEEKPKYKKLFNIVKPPKQIPHIPHQYVHFGLKSTSIENRSRINFEHESIQCKCSSDAKIFVNISTLSGRNMPTEGGNPPTSTISTPTGTDAPKKEGMGLNIICNNQYVQTESSLPFANFLPDSQINETIKTENPKVKIALIDTGLDRKGKNATFLSGAQNVCEMFNKPDTNGHGTFVYYFTKVGLAKKGINDFGIYPYNVADEEGNIIYGKALCAIVDAASRGINTINLSFGFYEHLPEFHSFLDLLIQEYPDVKIICSAGNENMEVEPFLSDTVPATGENKCFHPPSYYHSKYACNIYQITALSFYENEKNNTLLKCNFSNFGNSPNLACQGLYRLKLNNENCEIGGTSFAAPFFAGYFSDLSKAELKAATNNILFNPNIPSAGLHKSAIPIQHYIRNHF